MKVTKHKQKLEVILESDFNLNAVKHISSLMKDRSELSIDLVNARFVTSKAIVYLHNLMHADKQISVRLKNPPKIFFELLKTLELHEVWNLEEIVQP